MREDDFANAINTGHDNAWAVELLRRHCIHGRIELVNGNSFVGASLNIPMGLMEIRCTHAQPPRTQSPRALDLAVEFYDANCVECPHRKGTGELPNLSTEANLRATAEADRRMAAVRATEDLTRRREQRREKRAISVAGEGYVVRDLADLLNSLDKHDGPAKAETTGNSDAGRKLIESAKNAPDLFTPILVETLLDMSNDVCEPSTLIAIGALVKASKCAPRLAIKVALSVLARQPLREAGQLVVLLCDELEVADLADAVIDNAITLSAGIDDHWRPTPFPEALLSLAHFDLVTVTTRVEELLTSDDETLRADASDAAGSLLAADPSRIFGLGPALVLSIQGQDRGYSGTPHPATAAARAIAQAWRKFPVETQRIVETHAASLSDEVKAEIVRIPWFMRPWFDDGDASKVVIATTIDFLIHRIYGDWGEEAADTATSILEDLVRDVPNQLVSHTDAILGQILALSQPMPSGICPILSIDTPDLLATLERQSVFIQRGARRRRLAQAVGRSARCAPDTVLPKLTDLFKASSGVNEVDLNVRLAILDSLEEATSAATLRDILPIVYSAILGTDTLIRAAAIDLWAACARIGDIPNELAELAVPILQDTFVVVHRRMLERLGQLDLPPHFAPKLLPVVTSWAETYKNDPDVLENALWAIRSLAMQLEDKKQSALWLHIALSLVTRCRAYDSERLLTAHWPAELHNNDMWVQSALATLASPELLDRYNQRRQPLYAQLMDRPRLIEKIPFDDILKLSDLHGSESTWRALEPIELLQAAGRWGDAFSLAERVENRQLPGNEGRLDHALADALVAGAHLSQLQTLESADTASLFKAIHSVQDAVSNVETLVPDRTDDNQLRNLLHSLLVPATAASAFLGPLISDPVAAAIELDIAADAAIKAAGTTYASASQRRHVAEAWRVAANLLRYDRAVRDADTNAERYLSSAKRQAQVLRGELDQNDEFCSVALLQFLVEVGSLTSPAEVPAICKILVHVPAPVHLIDRLVPPPFIPNSTNIAPSEPSPLAICVATIDSIPVTDILVVRPHEFYTLGMTVRLTQWPSWAKECRVELVSTLSREAISLPTFSFTPAKEDASSNLLLSAEQPLYCAVQQSIRGEPIDCPLIVRLIGDDDREELIDVGGYRHLRLRPFDPSRETLTKHEQTDARLLQMFDVLNDPAFDREDARAFCRLFSACVRAGQAIMFEKAFMQDSRVSETQFHNELERHLRADSELDGRLTRRDAVAGGFDDLLHDDVIAELKVTNDKSVNLDDCARYLGQPTQYGVGRGSQLSILVVLDHSRKESPPGVIENYIGWLQPRLHNLDDPRYPSLVGVLIVNTNLPIPSDWGRHRIAVQADDI